MKSIVLLAATAVLVSCGGYHLGGLKPASLAHVHQIAVPMFKNDTLHPRAEALATSAVTDAMAVDGTYRVSSLDRADAILEGKIAEISYQSIRGTRYNTLRPEELANTVVLRWTLRDARNPGKILASGSSKGNSQLYVSSNLQTARNNALPDALEQAGEALISTLATGY